MLPLEWMDGGSRNLAGRRAPFSSAPARDPTVPFAVNAILGQAKEANLYDGWYKDAVELGKSENAQELTLG